MARPSQGVKRMLKVGFGWNRDECGGSRRISAEWSHYLASVSYLHKVNGIIIARNNVKALSMDDAIIIDHCNTEHQSFYISGQASSAFNQH